MERSSALEMITALIARPEVMAEAREAFRLKYPDAPPEMIDTAAFHVCQDGIDAALEWIANIELFLRSPSKGLNYGSTWHLVYHLYNWLQFQALLPLGRAGIVEHLRDAQVCIDEESPDAAKQSIQLLIDQFTGDVGPPGVG